MNSLTAFETIILLYTLIMRIAPLQSFTKQEPFISTQLHLIGSLMIYYSRTIEFLINASESQQVNWNKTLGTVSMNPFKVISAKGLVNRCFYNLLIELVKVS